MKIVFILIISLMLTAGTTSCDTAENNEDSTLSEITTLNNESISGDKVEDTVEPIETTEPIDTAESTEPTEPTEPLVSRLTVGAHYYPWYNSSRHWNEGYLRSKLQPAQEPFLGEYDSGDPKVCEQHIKWAKDYGLDYFMMSWWGPEKFEDNNIKNGFLKAENISDIKFGILYETTGRLGALVNDRVNFNENTSKILKKDFEYLAQNYFNHPSYLKFEGKPVVYFYLSRCFGGDFAGVINELRNDIRQKYNMELFLIGDEIYWEKTYLSEDKLNSLDAFSIYNPHNNDRFAGEYEGNFDVESGISQMYSAALESAKTSGSHFIPAALPGFNDRGVRLDAGHASIPREMNKGEEGNETTFRESLELAYKYRDTELNTILITSWNEWHEDSQIEPVKIEKSITDKPDNLTEGFKYVQYGLKDLELLKEFKDKYNK